MIKKQINCMEIRDRILKEVTEEIYTKNVTPSLLIIQLGDNQASNKYVKNKMLRAEESGIRTKLIKLKETTQQQELINIIVEEQKKHSAIIVQCPLPKHIEEKEVMKYIDPKKDCDGLNIVNIGLLHSGEREEAIVPATPYGVVRMFEMLGVDLTGKEVLIIGRSNLVGKPLADLMLLKNATVTIAHSKTKNLQKKIESGDYDIVVGAIGVAKFLKNVKCEYIVDVGINLDENGKLCGDFDIDSCTCDYYTPVPKGCGLLTQGVIIENVLKCEKRHN